MVAGIDDRDAIGFQPISERHGRMVQALSPDPDIADRALTLSGRVVDKRIEGEKNIVELEIVTIAEGQPSVRGNVAVELPKAK